MAISKLILNGEVQMDVTSNTNAANNMLNGVVGTKNDGTKVTGTIASKSSSDLTVSGSTVTAPAGYYSTAATKSISAGSAFPPAVTITKAPTFSMNSSTGVITASYAGSSSITPTITSGWVSQGTAGTISTTGTSTFQLLTKAGVNIYPSTADYAIASYMWLTGQQTFKSVVTSNLTASNIAEGVVVKIGDANNASRITQITGTHSSGGFTCTLTNAGRTNTYVTYNDVQYYTSGDTFNYKAGDSITFRAAGGDFNYIYINDKVVASSSTGATVTYTLVALNCDISVRFILGYATTDIYITIPEIDITENGKHEVDGYGYANVNVVLDEGFTTDQIAMRTISGEISGNATSISSYAFYQCTSLNTVNFPSCTSIGNYAFNSCYSLNTISFPSCTYIGFSAFAYCSSLTMASFPLCATISSYAFASCSNLTTANFSLCISIGNSAFGWCYSLNTISFPSCTYIGNYAFRSCGLITVNFPRCSIISSYAFAYCSRITTVSFPLCKSIYTYAFVDCSGLTTVNFPSCTSIGSSAFIRCGNLTTASFPSCTTIYGSAFNGCYNLLSLYLLGSSVPSLVYSTAFDSTPIAGYTTSTGGVYGSIFVPSSLYDSYLTATNWSLYSERIVSV